MRNAWPAKMLIGLALVGASLYIYRLTLQHDFVWDSVWYLRYNEYWLTSLRPEHLVWMTVSMPLSNWHPLTWLSWAFDYQLYGGLAPRGFHLTNNLLHAFNSVGVFALLYLLLRLPRQLGSRAARGPALAASGLSALLFALHPQHVESVAWVAQRKDLLFQLFALFSLFNYVQYGAQLGRSPQRKLGWSLFWYACACLSKPMAVTFPALLLLVDAFPLRRVASLQSDKSKVASIGSLLREKIPFFLLAGGLIAVTLVAQQEAMKNVGLDLRVLNAFHAIQFYLQNSLLPLNLSPFHPYFMDPSNAPSLRDAAPVALFVAISILACIAFQRGQPGWLVGWLFFLVAMSPVLGIVAAFGLQGAASRYTYFSMLPAFALVAAGLLRVFEARHRTLAVMTAVVTIFASVWLAQGTTRYLSVWKNQVTLWSHALHVYPNAPFINHQLGAAFIEENKFEEAAPFLDRATKLGSTRIDLLGWRGLVHLYLDHFEKALDIHSQLWKHGLTRQPPTVDMHCVAYNQGWLLARLERLEASKSEFERLPIDSPYAEVTRTWMRWIDTGGGDVAGLPGPCIAPLVQMRRRPLKATSG